MSELANDVADNGAKPRIRGTLRLARPMPVVPEPEPVAVVPEPELEPVAVKPVRVPVPQQAWVVYARPGGSVEPSFAAGHPWLTLPNRAVLFSGPLWLRRECQSRLLMCRIVVGRGPTAKRGARAFCIEVLQLDQHWRLFTSFRKAEALRKRFVAQEPIGRRFLDSLPAVCPDHPR